MSLKFYFFLSNVCHQTKINRGDKYACEYIEYNGKTVSKNKHRMWPQKFDESQTIHLKCPFTEWTEWVHHKSDSLIEQQDEICKMCNFLVRIKIFFFIS